MSHVAISILIVMVVIIGVIVIGVVGPKLALNRCLDKGGERTVGRDMLCIDSEGKFVK